MRALIFFLLPFLLLAQDPDDAPTDRNAAAVNTGKKAFAQTCGFCHGRDARGGASGPDLIRSSLVNHDVNGNAIAPVIKNGRPDKGMPAFQLSDKEIQDIAAFLHSEATGAASVARKIPTDYPLQKLLVGNVADGKAYFRERCSVCHAVDSDFAHIATKYKPFDLQTKIVFPAGAKPRVKATDPTGKVYEGSQVYEDEFLVSLRDQKGFVHTFPRATNSLQIQDPLAPHEQLLKHYTDKNVHDLFAYLETLK